MSRDLDPDEMTALRACLAQLQKHYPSQSVMARALDVNSSTLSRLVRGKQGASKAMADRVASLLGHPPTNRGSGAPLRRVFMPSGAVAPDSEADRIALLEQRVAALEAAKRATFGDADVDTMAAEAN